MTGPRSLSAPRDHGATEAEVRAVYDAQYGRLAGWVGRLVGDPDLGHDLATEAFIRLLRDFDRVEEPRAWLYTVAANLVRDHWRSRGREQGAFARATAAVPSTQVAPDTATAMTVRDVVLALPDRLRLVVILYYYADLPVATVALRTGKSVGAVKRDLFDARQHMAAQLEGVR